MRVMLTVLVCAASKTLWHTGKTDGRKKEPLFRQTNDPVVAAPFEKVPFTLLPGSNQQ